MSEEIKDIAIESGSVVILELLKKRGIVSPYLMKGLLGFMKKWDVDAYRAVVETHTVDESRLADILSEEFKFPRVHRLRGRPVDRKALELISYQEAMSWNVLPYAYDGSIMLHVAVADPSRADYLDTVRRRSKVDILFQVAEKSEIVSHIQKQFPLSLQLPETMRGFASAPGCSTEG